jgi:hypothetical protein
MIGKILVLAGMTAFFVLPSPGQGHFIDTLIRLPDTAWSTPVRRLSVSPNTMDVRAIGMGKTRIADERSQSWVTYSPAMLARDTADRGIGSIYFDAPFQTIDAITFVSSNAPDLDSAFSLRALQEAIEAYRNGENVTDDVLEKLDKFEAFVQEALSKLIGDPSNPDVHNGMGGINAQMQVGHWGFSLSAYGQSGMTVRMGTAFQELMEIYFTTDFNDSAQVADAIERLGAITDAIIDPVTGEVNTSGLPAIFALTYADVMATAGYGMTVFDAVDVGANLKVINRRFTVNRMSFSDAAEVPDNLFRGLDYSVTGVTLDLGGYYKAPSGLAVGLSLANVIPFRKLSTAYQSDYSTVWLKTLTDSAGNPIVNVDGDTAVAAYTQSNDVSGPAELELPFVANAGMMFPVTSDWDVSLEIVDIFAEETRYPDYGERVGVGSEYRLRFFGDKFHVSPRLGFAQLNVTAGLGLSYAGVVRLDLAYFTSGYVDERKMIAGQLSVAW